LEEEAVFLDFSWNSMRLSVPIFRSKFSSLETGSSVYSGGWREALLCPVSRKECGSSVSWGLSFWERVCIFFKEL